MGLGHSGSATFCRLGRLADDAFGWSGSEAGLGSRTAAFRFRDGVGRVDEAAAGAVGAELPEVSEEAAACLADRRVILDDMSI